MTSAGCQEYTNFYTKKEERESKFKNQKNV